MTKSQLVEDVAKRLGLTRGEARLLVDTVFATMTDALVRGERVEVRGFGSFEVRQYGAYEGRNPRTGEAVRVAPKRLPYFKAGKEIRERINRKMESEQEGETWTTR